MDCCSAKAKKYQTDWNKDHYAALQLECLEV